MGCENEAFVKAFYRTLEAGIERLSAADSEALYRPCAVNCVERYVLAEQQRQFQECGCDLDRQYEKYGHSEYFFADIVEKGRVYEIGYPVSSCICPMVRAGIAASPVHCACSLESMRCVLNTLLPDKHVKVEMMHSVLSGASECRFRVTVE